MEEEIQVPVYLLTGFLESGKTSFLKFTLSQDYFAIPEKTLLIVCEEGEEVYEQKLLEHANTVLEVVESKEELTVQRLAAMDICYSPGRVLIEYNGMWPMSILENMRFPAGWGIVQQITTVDASTFGIFLSNMKSLFMDMVRQADLVLFNRSSLEEPLASYRRSIKVVNQRAEIIFEDEEGELEDIFEGEMPFDLEAPVVEIAPEDYGLWYVDAMEYPEKYQGKVVHFKGRVLKPSDFPREEFVPGRMAMTCCADDTTFIGIICESKDTPHLKEGGWVDVQAEMAVEYKSAYHGEGPVLRAKKVRMCDPLEEEMVYFN